MAASATMQEVLWLRSLLKEMGYEQREATVLQSDNQSAIAIAADDVQHSRTKHIDIRHHFIRQHIAAGVARMQYVRTEDNLADMLTKPLGAAAFLRLRAGVLGGREL